MRDLIVAVVILVCMHLEATRIVKRAIQAHQDEWHHHQRGMK